MVEVYYLIKNPNTKIAPVIIIVGSRSRPKKIELLSTIIAAKSARKNIRLSHVLKSFCILAHVYKTH